MHSCTQRNWRPSPSRSRSSRPKHRAWFVCSSTSSWRGTSLQLTARRSDTFAYESDSHTQTLESFWESRSCWWISLCCNWWTSPIQTCPHFILRTTQKDVKFNSVKFGSEFGTTNQTTTVNMFKQFFFLPSIFWKSVFIVGCMTLNTNCTMYYRFHTDIVVRGHRELELSTPKTRLQCVKWPARTYFCCSHHLAWQQQDPVSAASPQLNMMPNQSVCAVCPSAAGAHVAMWHFVTPTDRAESEIDIGEILQIHPTNKKLLWRKKGSLIHIYFILSLYLHDTRGPFHTICPNITCQRLLSL